MEDDNGLELSLGLSFGGSSGKEKGKSGSSHNMLEETDRGSKIVNDFKNFLNPGMHGPEPTIISQADFGKPSGNFFNDLSRSAADAGSSKINLSARNLWAGGNYRAAETEEEKVLEQGNKRRMLFGEINQPKRHEKEAYSDAHDTNKMLHIPVPAEEGSTADHEDVADSEIESSTFRTVTCHDSSMRYPPEFQKEVQGQKRTNHDGEFKVGNPGYVVPFAVQSMNLINGPPSVTIKDATAVGAPVISGHYFSGLDQVMPAIDGERSEAQPMAPNLPVMFGYSPVQLPTFDNDNSWDLISHGQQLHSPYTAPVISHTLPELNPHGGKMMDLSKADGKNILEEGPRNVEKSKGKPEGPTVDGSAVDLSAIRPGMAADLKFGGCGSYPNLPWVSTTSSNGRTISGVTYKFSANQIRIVCACHGSHMSPEEFVGHAAEDHPNQDGSSGVSNLSSKNPAASAQS